MCLRSLLLPMMDMLDGSVGENSNRENNDATRAEQHIATAAHRDIDHYWSSGRSVEVN